VIHVTKPSQLTVIRTNYNRHFVWLKFVFILDLAFMRELFPKMKSLLFTHPHVIPREKFHIRK